MLARMPGRLTQPWCPYCHGPAGWDCPDRSPDVRQVRRRLQRELDREITDAITQEQP